MKNEKIIEIKKDIVRMFERTNYASNSIDERLEKPLLLSAVCLKTIEKIVSLSEEEQNCLIELLKNESFEKGTFIAIFYYSIYARNGEIEKMFFQNNKDLYNDGKRIYGDTFVVGNPIFEEETFWTFILNEDFLLEYDNISLAEMFGAIIAYAIPNEMKMNIQYFLLRFLKEFEKDLIIPINYFEKSMEKYVLDFFKTTEIMKPGKIFIDTFDNHMKVYIGTTNEGFILSRVFLDVDCSLEKNEEKVNVIPF